MPRAGVRKLFNYEPQPATSEINLNNYSAASPTATFSKHALVNGAKRCDGNALITTNRRMHMSDHIYRVTEIVGTSPDGIDAAVRAGVERAANTLHGLDWFEVKEIRGHIVDGRVAHYQVSLKVGFRLDQA